MQWLYDASDESPDLKGLGLLSGRITRLRVENVAQAFRPADAGLTPCATADRISDATRDRIKVPHVGWNSLSLVHDAPIVDGIANGAQVYFTHSYVAPVTADTAAVTEHGGSFASVVQRGRIAGVQFHPEKSGEVGLRILRNFLLLTSSF